MQLVLFSVVIYEHFRGKMFVYVFFVLSSMQPFDGICFHFSFHLYHLFVCYLLK